MTFWSLSVHMLCGLFMSTCGSAAFFDTDQCSTSTAVAVPGLNLPAVFSNCVSTHTSPTPGVVGFTLPGGSVLGSSKYWWKKPSSVGSSSADPSLLYVRIGAGGYFGSHVLSASGWNVCQLLGTVALKNVCTSWKIRSEYVGTTTDPLYMLT